MYLGVRSSVLSGLMPALSSIQQRRRLPRPTASRCQTDLALYQRIIRDILSRKLESQITAEQLFTAHLVVTIIAR